jgi:nucleoside-diphosphate-sugar epimerase
MTKIALLGAGWLGEPLAHQLQTTGYQVQCSTTSADKAARLQTAGLASTVLQVTPTGIRGSVDDFFAADILILTLPPGGRSNPAVATDYPAKVRHLIAAAQAGKIQHVLFTSSTGVYGDTDGWVSEDAVLRPNTPSGQALQVVEQELRAAFGARLTILRLAGLAGADRQPGRWFAGRQNLPDGQVGVNLVHQQDVIRIIEHLLTNQQWGLLLNVCADAHPTKAVFYPAAAQALGLEPPTFAPAEAIPNGKLVDNTRSKTALNFTYMYPDPLGFPTQSEGEIGHTRTL